jgi:hypothetical protein
MPTKRKPTKRLRWKSEDGTTTLVRFRHILPEESERQLPDVA